MIGISYMGTKQQLAHRVATLISECSNGGFLDLFAGMCSVGTAVGASRQVWANDLQIFSCEVARAKFCSKGAPLSSYQAGLICHAEYETNRRVCARLYGDKLARETKALGRQRPRQLDRLFEETLSVCRTTRHPAHRYQLITRYFGGSYFGVYQSVEADSIRAAIDHALDRAGISEDQHRWLLLALCVALSRCSTSTGHFAQPLAPKVSNLRKFVSQRKRTIWFEWLAAIDSLSPVGVSGWREGNRVFNADARELLDQLSCTRVRPRVIYADPPYTKDQYSRYYHLYETAILYDYPGTTGRGQYREGRQVSDFCLPARVESAFVGLIEKSARLRADLIISYPTNGLLPNSRERIPDFIRRIYGRAPEAFELAHAHSTMGASKGRYKNDVVEVFYRIKRND